MHLMKMSLLIVHNRGGTRIYGIHGNGSKFTKGVPFGLVKVPREHIFDVFDKEIFTPACEASRMSLVIFCF